tara:strand:+ start:417 stop:641 length:225 start_codon:yes stop_codon:yes gene_type:complete
MPFEQLGYYKEYIVGNKTIGIIQSESIDQGIGYENHIKTTLKEPLILDNGNTIKKGLEVKIIAYPFNGKRIRKQ